MPSGGSWVYISIESEQAYISNYTSHIKLLYTYDTYDGIIDLSLPDGNNDFSNYYNDFVGGCVYSGGDVIPIKVSNQNGYMTILDARYDISMGIYIKGYYYWQEG